MQRTSRTPAYIHEVITPYLSSVMFLPPEYMNVPRGLHPPELYLGDELGMVLQAVVIGMDATSRGDAFYSTDRLTSSRGWVGSTWIS